MDSLNYCVSPYDPDSTTSSNASTARNNNRNHRGLYTLLEKPETLFECNAGGGTGLTAKNASQASTATSPVQPLKLALGEDKSPWKSRAVPKPKSAQFPMEDGKHFSPLLREGMESDSSSPFSDSMSPSGRFVSPSSQASLSRTSRASTPQVNNTSASKGMSSFTTGTPYNDSSLMNTMNLISSDSDDESDNSSLNKNSRRSFHSTPKDPPSQRGPFPYDYSMILKANKTTNDPDQPDYYRHAYWDQRLARQEVYSKRYRPSPEEKGEITELDEWLGMPEARKSRKVVLVQQWRLLNPSTSQASTQNVPMSIVLKRGPIRWGAHEECELILLTRGFVVARKVFQYIPRFQLGDIWTNVVNVRSTGSTSFCIQCHDKTLDFRCPTLSDQQAWMNALRIVVLQALTHHSSLLDTDDDEANAQFQEGWQYKVVQTPWFTEAVTGHVDIESNMLDQMDHNTLNTLDSYNQCSPLHYAIRNNNVGAMRFLLQAGANPNLKDGMGMSAMQYAEAEKLPKSSVELLRSYGGKIPVADQSCLLPVKNSRRCRCIAMLILLLLALAIGATTFTIWYLLIRNSDSAKDVVSSESSAIQNDEGTTSTADEGAGDPNASSSPPPFLVVGVNPIPATNMTTNSSDPAWMSSIAPTALPTETPSAPNSTTIAPANGTMPTMESNDILDALAELISKETIPPKENPTDEDTMAPTQDELITARPTMVPTSAPSAVPSDFLPLETSAPTSAVTEKAIKEETTASPTQARTAAPTNPAFDSDTYFLPLTTDAPTFSTAGTPTATPTEFWTTAPTSPPTEFLTPSPTSILEELTVAMPVGAVGQSGPSSSPTFESVNGLGLLPEDMLLFEFLVEHSLDSGAALRNPKSPQYKAFRWLSGNLALNTYSDERKMQRYALATLFFSTEGEAWSNNQYWLSDEDECIFWFSRITEVVSNAICNSQGQIVTLDLDYNNLRGELPKEVGLLTNLKRMELYGGPEAYLTGTIPTEIGLLQQLDSLSVRGNRLSGAIPSEFGRCGALSNLNLSQNQFSGIVPSTLGMLKQLESLAMETNRLAGSLPSELGQVSNLKSLTLGTNALTGDVFTEIGLMSMLRGFDVETNQLSSTIPSEVGMLANLTLFHMSGNRLKGTIPSEVGKMTSLGSLQLRGNALTSSIPTTMGKLSSLGALGVAFNVLSGPIPSEIGEATSLRNLQLNSNRLTGSVPTELAKLSKLNSIRVDMNDLTSSVPMDVCNVFLSTYPVFYADCMEVSCPCCSYCCIDGEACECVYANTADEFLC